MFGISVHVASEHKINFKELHDNTINYLVCCNSSDIITVMTDVKLHYNYYNKFSYYCKDSNSFPLPVFHLLQFHCQYSSLGQESQQHLQTPLSRSGTKNNIIIK